MHSIEMSILHHQYEVLNSNTEITAMSCGRGAGKTSTMCLVAIRDMLIGKKVLCVEPIISQFRTVLAPEMNAMLARMGITARYNKTNHVWNYGLGEILTISSEAAERLRGISEINTICFDECGSYDEMVYNLAYPTMRGLSVVDKKVYLFSTATTKHHWFAKKAMHENSNLIYATSANNQFNGIDYFPGLLREYEGLPDDFIQRELYGKFTDFSHNTIFKTIMPCLKPRNGLRTAGVDLALGIDYTSFVMFDGNILKVMEKMRTPKPEDAEKFIRQMCLLHKPVVVNYDCTGHGAYAEVHKWTNGVHTNAINFGMAGGKYADMRTKIYFDLYFKLNDFYQGADPRKYNELVEDLKATTIDENERAKVKLIEKKEIKKLIGRSPDYGDAAALAALDMNAIDEARNLAIQRAANPYNARR